MALIKLILISMAALVVFTANAQDFELTWSQAVAGSGMNWDSAEKIEFNPVNHSAIAGGTTYNAKGNTDLIAASISAEGEFEWALEWSYNEESHEYISDMLLADNGKVFICGETQISFGNDYAQAFLLAIENGKILWQQIYGTYGQYRDAPAEMIFDASGNIVLAGELNIENNNEIRKEAEIRIFDQNGNQLYNNSFVNSQQPYRFDYFNAVAKSPEGQITAAGTCQLSSLNFAVQLVGIDDYSNEVWATVHDFSAEPNYDLVMDLVSDTGNNSIVLVRTEDSWIIAKFDDTGVFQWQQSFETDSFLNFYGSRDLICLDENGNIYAIFPHFSGCTIVGIDAAGGLLWQNDLTNLDGYLLLPSCIKTNQNANLLVSFSKQLDDALRMGIHVAEFDKLNGQVLWSENFQEASESDGEAHFLCIAEDASFIYVGARSGESFEDQDMIIIKYANTNSYINPWPELPFVLYPVPAQDYIHLSPQEFQSGELYQLLDISGRIIATGIINDGFEIQISMFTSGVYLLKTSNATSRFVKS